MAENDLHSSIVSTKNDATPGEGDSSPQEDNEEFNRSLRTMVGALSLIRTDCTCGRCHECETYTIPRTPRTPKWRCYKDGIEVSISNGGTYDNKCYFCRKPAHTLGVFNGHRCCTNCADTLLDLSDEMRDAIKNSQGDPASWPARYGSGP